MQVDWTWRLAGLLVVTVGLSSLAAFGAASIALWLGLGPDIAALACIAAWIFNFLLIDRPANAGRAATEMVRPATAVND